MKAKYIIGLLCVAALTGLFTINKAPAQGNPNVSDPKVVILQTTIDESGFNYYGVIVYNSSSSEGAPKFPNWPAGRTPAAQAIADCMKAGLVIKHIGEHGNFFLMATPDPK